MEIQITQKSCGGTVFAAQPARLHLGAQNAEGVDTLQFELPDAWADCTVLFYLRRSDGIQLAPIPLENSCVTVDRRLTGCTSGQWMLAAATGSGYTAYTRPGSYDVYATLPIDGGVEELSPSQYEQFVARVLESASTAARAAQNAAASESNAAASAALAQAAAGKASASGTQAVDCAARAEAAAARAETLAPEDGTVRSVNGKGGVVVLSAQDVGALPRPAQPVDGELLRILHTDPDTGQLTLSTSPMPDLNGYVRSSTIPSAEAAGAVKADSAYGVSVRADGTLCTVPATEAQLDALTDAHCPLVPARLPYGVRKALTSADASWTEAEQTRALHLLGADTAFYSKAEADALFGAGYTLPAATASTLGGVKVGSNLSISPDGTLTANLSAGTADLTAGSSPLASGAVYLVYE